MRTRSIRNRETRTETRGPLSHNAPELIRESTTTCARMTMLRLQTDGQKSAGCDRRREFKSGGPGSNRRDHGQKREKQRAHATVASTAVDRGKPSRNFVGYGSTCGAKGAPSYVFLACRALSSSLITRSSRCTRTPIRRSPIDLRTSPAPWQTQQGSRRNRFISLRFPLAPATGSVP